MGVRVADVSAQILAQSGGIEGTLDEIERLLARPFYLSVHTLRLDPLRGNPRFQALLAKAVQMPSPQ
jgi:hypothetical protein